MFYSIVFLILSSSVWISSLEDWETFIDRLDLLIRDSYLIIQCDEHQFQINRYLTTYEELESNLKCTNKDQLLEHGIGRVQIVDFEKVVMKCLQNKIVRIVGDFNQVETSLEKDDNGVDWPFAHTPYTKETAKSDPYKMKFLEKKEILYILTELKSQDLPEEKEDLLIHFDFVNRPMVCRIRIVGLQKKTNDGTCEANILDQVYEPTCFYKVGGKSAPSHEEIDQIFEKTYSYVKSQKDNYTYISDIGTFVESNDHPHESTEETNSATEKHQKSDKNSSETGANSKKTKKRKKSSSPVVVLIIVVILLCLIGIIIGLVIFYRKYWSEEENDQLTKQKSDPSYESQVSLPSNQSESSKSPPKQFQNIKQKPPKQGGRNRFKLDDDI